MTKQLVGALAASDASVRLRAVLAVGANPEPSLVDLLVARCAIEPDFYVRDMLTWACALWFDPVVNAHASATDRLLRDPNAGSQFGVDQVKRMLAPGS